MVEPLPGVHETPGRLEPQRIRGKEKGREGKEKREEEKGEEKEDTSRIRINTLFLSCYPKYTYSLGYSNEVTIIPELISNCAPFQR